ncbi:phosphatidate cytidylyltransferase [Romeria aff. gracilis LEGE 07310]|uniref:Phosphatidate cytidylyltransferase n=1 Tax=Vasconcelosia minhoensis LEGE 07310 TaxID=915328 RepID=A0A8J7AWX6_9CYAN|nr:diacylglycerol/polyprenol kinase family protein [Romeria gracilis]MBE9078858.1 phosphatidate cytidylyltransferase [Romeria aff. gracilis LEGE 07310]
MTPSLLFLSCAAVLAWLGLVGIASEVARRLGTDTELTRKIVHIGAGHVILIAWWLAIPAAIGIVASVLFSGIALLSYRLPILPGVNSVGRKSLGTFFYAASMGLLMAWFWPLGQPQYAALGILIMTWGDGLAALVGQRYGQHLYQIWGEKKSWEGSLTMAAVSFAVGAAVLFNTQGASWQTWGVAVAVAIAATLLEAISKLGIDNLTVPLGTAALAFWLNQLL